MFWIVSYLSSDLVSLSVPMTDVSRSLSLSLAHKMYIRVVQFDLSLTQYNQHFNPKVLQSLVCHLFLFHVHLFKWNYSIILSILREILKMLKTLNLKWFESVAFVNTKSLFHWILHCISCSETISHSVSINVIQRNRCIVAEYWTKVEVCMNDIGKKNHFLWLNDKVKLTLFNYYQSVALVNSIDFSVTFHSNVKINEIAWIHEHTNCYNSYNKQIVQIPITTSNFV